LPCYAVIKVARDFCFISGGFIIDLFVVNCTADANIRSAWLWKDDPLEGGEFRHDSQCEG